MKIYNYIFRYTLILFGMTCIRYLMGNRGIFTSDRILFCVIVGTVFGIIFFTVDTFKNRRKKATTRTLTT